MSKRRRYKPEEKLAAVLEYVNGNKSYTEAGKVVGVDSWTVRDWVFRYKLEGAEAFFSRGILKRERYYGKRFTSRDDLVSMIENYITYYNNRRVQRNLGVLTPMEKHESYLMAA